jgi:hypothetical protein
MFRLPALDASARSGIGPRDLLVGRVPNRLLHLLKCLHLPTQTGDLVLDPCCLGFGDIALLAVGPVQRRQITTPARF